MSLSKFESEVKRVTRPQAVAYARVADLRNLEGVKRALTDPALRPALEGQVPADKLEQMAKYAEGMTFGTDTLTIATPMGEMKLTVVEREEPKLVKLASEGAPVQVYVWVQLLPDGEEQSLMRVTVGAEVNFFLKGMVSKPLQQAADGLGEMLSRMASV